MNQDATATITLGQVVVGSAGLGFALLAWSLKSNIRTFREQIEAGLVGVAAKVDGVATDVRALSVSVGDHGRQLAAGGAKIEELERGKERLEQLGRDLSAVSARVEVMQRALDSYEQRERECPGRLRVAAKGE